MVQGSRFIVNEIVNWNGGTDTCSATIGVG